jgi:uncharacterized protein DUF4268
MAIGKLERVELRDVWKHEATDFTRWLEENIDVLNEVLDITLSNPEREQAAGKFSVDLVTEDRTGGTVIIENQLEKSDHDHLGKVITYLAAFDAKAAVWIVAKPRPEHVKAIGWLNESTSANFYLVKVEAVLIEGSSPAPLFTVIIGPSEESKQVGETKKKLAEQHDIRLRFWEGLLTRAKPRTSLHSAITAGPDNWIGAGSGKGGLAFNYVARRHDAQVELYIDTGKDSEQRNKAIFDEFMIHRDDIETVFGEPLIWQRLDGKRACRIMKNVLVGGYADENAWPDIHDKLIDAMIRLEKALRPYIDNIK